MHITPFAVEIWMNDWETKCAFNLAETCVESLTLSQLMTLTGKNDTDYAALSQLKMTYGAIPGSDGLLRAISGLYARQMPENLIVTHGTIGANMLVHKAMVAPGDKVVTIVPTYQQHTAIPESIGANVCTVPLRWEDNFLPDLDALRAAVTPDTRLIAINNPNNPTGALMDRAMLDQIVDIARQADAWIVCDEVYRGVDQHGSGMTDAIADIYEKGISTAGMSKAFSLAGLRLGWIAAPPEVIEAVAIHRDYNTISVGRIDDYFATMALENFPRLLERSQNITRTNLSILADWVAAEPLIDWVRPQSGTTTLLRYNLPMTSRAFCIALLEDCGVMLTPGDCFGMEGTVRVGFGNPTAELQQGLQKLSAFLAAQNA